MLLTKDQIDFLAPSLAKEISDKYIEFLLEIEQSETFQQRLKEYKESADFIHIKDMYKDFNKNLQQMKDIIEDEKDIAGELFLTEFWALSIGENSFTRESIKRANTLSDKEINDQLHKLALNKIKNEFHLYEYYWSVEDYAQQIISAHLALINSAPFEVISESISKISELDIDTLFKRFNIFNKHLK